MIAKYQGTGRIQPVTIGLSLLMVGMLGACASYPPAKSPASVETPKPTETVKPIVAPEAIPEPKAEGGPAMTKPVNEAKPMVKPKPKPVVKPNPLPKPAIVDASKPSPEPRPEVPPESMTAVQSASPAQGPATPVETHGTEAANATGPSAGALAAEAPAVALTPDQLPMTIGGWVLDREAEGCQLKSPAQELFDGYGQAHVSLIVNGRGFRLKADSQFDTSYPNAGYQFDGDAATPLPKPDAGGTMITVPGDFSRDWTGHQNLTIAVGFWPTWPVTETRQIVFSLSPVAEAAGALAACQKL